MTGYSRYVENMVKCLILIVNNGIILVWYFCSKKLKSVCFHGVLDINIRQKTTEVHVKSAILPIIYIF